MRGQRGSFRQASGRATAWTWTLLCLQGATAWGQGYSAPTPPGRGLPHELQRPAAAVVSPTALPHAAESIRYPDVAFPHPASPPLPVGQVTVDHDAERYPLGHSAESPGWGGDGALNWQATSNDSGSCGANGFCCDGPLEFSSCAAPPQYGVGGGGGCGRLTHSPLWFGAAYGLFMQRSPGELRYVTDDVGAATRVLSNRDAAFDYQGGTELRIGRRLPGCWAIEAAWWGLGDSSSSHQIWGGDYTGLATRLDFEGLEVDQGAATSAVNDYYDGAENHRVARSFSATNVELNLLCIPMLCTPCASCTSCSAAPRLTMSWNVGVRYLELEEAFRFWADAVDTAYGDPLDEIYYNIDVRNQLLGAQAGGHMHFCLCQQFAIFTDINAGLYGNRIHSSQQVENPEGYAYANNGAHLNQAYDLNSGAHGVSMVAELRIGSHFQWTPRWRTTFAYRLMGVAGVALPEDQIPDYFDDYVDAQRIRKDGGLLLHGFMFGMEHRF